MDRQAETFGFSKAAAALVVFVLLGLVLIASWGNCAAAKSDAEPLADQAESSDALPSEKDYTLSQVLEALSKRDTKYSVGRFRIDYRRTVNDSQDKEPRTEYDLLLSRWRSYREEAQAETGRRSPKRRVEMWHTTHMRSTSL